MALAQIIDLEERRARRAARAPAPAFAPAMAASNDAMINPWCYCWMPMYFWYVA